MTTTTSTLGFPCPSISSSQILVDDSDVTRIHYSGNWSILDSSTGGSDLVCNGSTHASAHQAGNQTTATFSFEGVGVEVYGSIPSDSDTASSYQVDNLHVFNLTFKSRHPDYDRIQLYASPQLEPGNHTLVISALGTHSNQTFLDYIIYNPIPSATNATASALSSSTLPKTSATAAAPSISSKSASGISTGALVGGILGGTILGLALGILSMFHILQRRKKKNTIGIAPFSTFSSSATGPISKRPATAKTKKAGNLATMSAVPQRTYIRLPEKYQISASRLAQPSDR
ncbi:hypothetical protein GYMLUDRAFT_61735 [Collybiopsis luxurians FD-317 M1]|uniref:Uncharacterized protein n=1 Tax=Collybiopsis luxurians FD-317 M1 TaxID=944289 RepID=A0A0D0BP89_9AGAR|nr:hypothetical protein GYMLUDRAFT_61735 [Collybiopsis luxurians FD-317 M1]